MKHSLSRVAATGLIVIAVASLTGRSLRAASAAPGRNNSPLMQFGRWEIRPHFAYVGSYTDGLLVRPGFPNNSYIDSFSPGLLIALGQQWSVDYTPTFTTYSNPAFRDTLTHQLNATGGAAYAGSTLGLHQGYRYSSTPMAETGRQTDTESVVSDLKISRAVGRKLTLVGGAEQNLSFVSAAPDFHQWSVFGGIQVAFTNRVSGTLGSRLGYVAIYKSADSVYAQPGGDLTWRPTDKLTLSGGISIDERVVLARVWRWRESPVYVGSVHCAPFSTTSLDASVSRAIAPSFFGGQTADSTTAGASVEQRLLQHFWVGAGIDYSYSNYLTTGQSAGVRRRDTIWTYKASLRTTFLRHGSIAVSYRDVDNSSSLPGFVLKSRRIECDVSYRY